MHVQRFNPAPATVPGAAGWRRTAVLIAMVGAAAALAGCKSEAKIDEEAARPVKVAVVQAAARSRVLSYSGVVRARIESVIGFRVAGKIVQRAVNVGERIEVGQVIARLDDTDLKLAENSAKAAVASARSRRDVASDNLDRAKVLLPKAIISQAAYDTRRNELDAATSALESAQAQFLQAANAVSYTTLMADKAGIVTAVAGEPGQVVGAGQAVITLADAGDTEIAVSVPEQDAGRIVVGQLASITLWAGPRTSTAGSIREIAGQADAASRTYAVRVAASDPPTGMRLGMTATVTIRIDAETPGMVVPLTALTEAEGSPVVFVVDADKKTVRMTPVTLAATAEDGIHVATGLQAGDMVVTAGVQFLRQGMRVRLPGERSQARPGKSI